MANTCYCYHSNLLHNRILGEVSGSNQFWYYLTIFGYICFTNNLVLDVEQKYTRVGKSVPLQINMHWLLSSWSWTPLLLGPGRGCQSLQPNLSLHSRPTETLHTCFLWSKHTHTQQQAWRMTQWGSIVMQLLVQTSVSNSQSLGLLRFKWWTVAGLVRQK